MWDNCITFNGRESWVGKHAGQLREFTARKFSQAKLTDDQLLSNETGTPRVVGALRGVARAERKLIYLLRDGAHR